MHNLIVVFLVACFIFILFIIIHLLRRLKKFRYTSQANLPFNISELPTVSVCVPARNEVHAMTACLERVAASTYPKLEIIVLDDSSVDETSFLIRSFAHAGIRFVEGSPLPDGWLGKSHAQQTLYEESSGDYILYIDVDTHLEPQAIDRLVATAMAEKVAMISVLPTRNDQLRPSVFLATLRHLWVILTDRTRRPAANSNAWFVSRSFLDNHFQGFESVRLMIEPERLIAATASNLDAYRFYISNQRLGISYEKKWQSQCATSIRLLFPMFGGRLLNALLGFTGLIVLFVPFIIPFNLLVQPLGIVTGLALMDASLLVAMYAFYTNQVWRRGWLLGAVLLPYIFLQEIVLLLFSIIAYTTRTVTWKGRPVQHSARRASEPIHQVR